MSEERPWQRHAIERLLKDLKELPENLPTESRTPEQLNWEGKLKQLLEDSKFNTNLGTTIETEELRSSISSWRGEMGTIYIISTNTPLVKETSAHVHTDILEGVKLQLLKFEPKDQEVIISEKTVNKFGQATFEDIAPGTYKLKVAPQEPNQSNQ